jgi:hypothetical protein
MGDHSLQLSADLLKDKKVCKALDICEEGKFTPEELDAYEREWMRISNEVAMLGASYEEGEKIGEARGIEIAKAGAEAEAKAKIEADRRDVAKELKAMGIPIAQISAATKLSVEEIGRL